MQDFFNEPKPDDVAKYVVVWQSGHNGERDLDSFDNYWKALDWIGENYSDDEIEANNINIATLLTSGERTYES